VSLISFETPVAASASASRPTLGDEVPAAVFRIATALDEPLLLELVEQPHELAAVVAQRVGDRALRLGRSQSARAGSRGGGMETGPPRMPSSSFPGGESEALEQERGEATSSSGS